MIIETRIRGVNELRAYKQSIGKTATLTWKGRRIKCTIIEVVGKVVRLNHDDAQMVDEVHSKLQNKEQVAELIRFNKKTSKKRENKLASDMEGKRHALSGALWWKKGDVSDAHFLWEDKFTSNTYYTLSLKILDKIKKEALAVGKIPILRIGFMPKNENFVVLQSQYCAVAPNNIITQKYTTSSHKLSIFHLLRIYYKSTRTLLEIILNDNKFIVIPWDTFLEIKDKIVKGEKI